MKFWLLFGTVLAAAAVPSLAQAQDWHGTLRCGEVTGHTGPGKFDLSVSQNGSRLSFSRPMRTSDGGFANSAETGTGTLDGEAVDLQGTFTDRGSSMASHYAGRIVEGRMRLTGEQVWTFPRKAEIIHRTCMATLAH